MYIAKLKLNPNRGSTAGATAGLMMAPAGTYSQQTVVPAIYALPPQNTMDRENATAGDVQMTPQNVPVVTAVTVDQTSK